MTGDTEAQYARASKSDLDVRISRPGDEMHSGFIKASTVLPIAKNLEGADGEPKHPKVPTIDVLDTRNVSATVSGAPSSPGTPEMRERRSSSRQNDEARRSSAKSGHVVPSRRSSANAQEICKEASRSTVMSLVTEIHTGGPDGTKRGAIELRLLAKWSMANRILIGDCGCISLLLSLLSYPDFNVQENAITCLLNLSIYQPNRVRIIEASNSLDCISEVLKSGATLDAKGNAAALITSLMVVEEYRDVVGKNSVVIVSLFELLRASNLQTRKDAIKATFQLALWPSNRSRLVRAGAILRLIGLLKSPSAGLIEDTLAVLAQLARSGDGASALKDPATISIIMDFLKHGSGLTQENAAALLLALCETGKEKLVKVVRRHRGTIVGVLYTILAEGSERGKTKANGLMNILVANDTTGEMVFDLLNETAGDSLVLSDYESRRKTRSRRGSWSGRSGNVTSQGSASSLELE